MNTIKEHLTTYLTDIRFVHGSGKATDERSYYPALAALLGHIGADLTPRVKALHDVKDRGVGHREQGRGVDEHDVVLGAQLLEEVCHLLRPVTRQRWPARLLRLWRQPSLLRSWR